MNSNKSSWYSKKIRIQKTFSHRTSFFRNISMGDLPELFIRRETKSECAKIRRSPGNAASVSCKNLRHTPILSVISMLPFVVIDHFIAVCLVAWPLNESEAGVDLVLIETSLLFIWKCVLISMRTASST